MVVAWLVSCPNHSQRWSVNGRRLRCRLPDDGWLNERLSRAGVQRAARSDGVLSFAAVGLVRLRAGACYEGTLTNWSKECDVMYKYFLQPQDAFELVVESTFCLDDPQPIYHKIDSRGRVSKISSLDGAYHPCGLSDQIIGAKPGCLLRGGECTAADIARAWGVPQAEFSNIVGISLVAEICQLVMKGEWVSILQLARWPRSLTLIPDYPPAYIVDGRGKHSQHAAEGDTLDSEARCVDSIVDHQLA